MKRLDPRTVELLPGELNVHDQFDDALTDGLGIRDAAWKVLPRHGRRQWNQAPRWITAEFVEYLSDGTLTVWRDHYYDLADVPRSSGNLPNTQPTN